MRTARMKAGKIGNQNEDRLKNWGLTCGFLAHFSSKSFLALSRKSWTEKKNKSGTLIHDYNFTYFVWIFPFFFEFLFCGFEKFLDCLFPIIINKNKDDYIVGM